MYELVISGGDSFTFGAELKTDNGIEPNPNSWANLVAQRIGKKHVNVARSGRSNSYIVRHILHEISCSDVDPSKIFVQVMWTFTDRSEFAIAFNTGEYDSPWIGLTPFSHLDESESDWFKRVDNKLPTWKSVYNNLKSVYNKNKDLGVVEFALQYRKLTQTEPLNDSYSSLKEILLLQNVLKTLGIQYLFTYVDQHVANGLFEDAKYSAGSKYLSSIRLLVDRNNSWYNFPGEFQQYIGFNDWARYNRYNYATSHPLEQAHQDAANLIYNYIVSKYDTE